MYRYTSNSQNIRWSLFAAIVTAVSIFILTHWCAWITFWPYVAYGPYYPLSQWRSVAYNYQHQLDKYAKEHGHYPDVLKDAFPDSDSSFVDLWKNPYQYSRAEDGYRLVTLGRDGKHGGIGLDADVDLHNPRHITVQVTFSQFLLEGEGSKTLFKIALMSSLCSGLACLFAIGRRRKKTAISWRGVFFTTSVTFVASLFVVFQLLMFYLIGSGH